MRTIKGPRANKRSRQGTVESGKLALRYQPIFDMASSTLGLRDTEALIQWDDSKLDLSAPNPFRTATVPRRILVETTDCVFRKIARQLQAWREHHINLSVSVDIATALLEDDEFPSRLSCILKEFSVHRSALLLQVAERGFLPLDRLARSILDELVAQGFRLVVVEFGSGAVFLGQLANLPIEGLKLDRQLVGRIRKEERARRLVRGIIDLSHDLNMWVAAEAVGEENLFFSLKGLGCDKAQGGWLCEPVPAALLENTFQDARQRHHRARARQNRVS